MVHPPVMDKYRSKLTTPECIYGQQIAMMDIATHGRFHETQNPEHKIGSSTIYPRMEPPWHGARDCRMPVFKEFATCATGNWEHPDHLKFSSHEINNMVPYY
jgi:hypothetical protein